MFVTLSKVPESLTNGLDKEDIEAIMSTTKFSYVQTREDGKIELDFSEEDGTMHTIWVEPEYVIFP